MEPPKRSQVGTVLSRARLDKVEEDVTRLENTGVVGEQAEDEAYEEPFKIVELRSNLVYGLS